MSELVLEVITGREGDCLAIDHGSHGTRIAGPKPWGGGRATKRFVVKGASLKDLAEAVNRATEEAPPRKSVPEVRGVADDR